MSTGHRCSDTISCHNVNGLLNRPSLLTAFAATLMKYAATVAGAAVAFMETLNLQFDTGRQFD